MELLSEMAEEQGIDFDDMDLKTSMMEDEAIREEADEHALSKAAKKYSEMVGDWFDLNEKLFLEREQDLNMELNLGLDKKVLEREAASIIDAVEVIRWYQPQIYVKLMRALMQNDFDDSLEEDSDYPKDSDGSAKVALIGMDRSIGAWGRLIEHFPEKTDDILTTLLHLDRLRRKVEKVFPEARNFIRPGFDTHVTP